MNNIEGDLAAVVAGAPLKKNVYVVEDDDSMRQALRRMLEKSGYSVMTFESAEMLFRAWNAPTPAVAPDCLILDVVLPGANGVDVQSRIQNHWIGVPIIFITGEADPRRINQAWREGASDFLLKPFTTYELTTALGNAFGMAHAANTPVGGTLADKAESNAVQTQVAKLSARERQLLQRIARGLTNQQIADELGIGLRTVKMHRANLMNKLDIDSVADLVRFHDRCAGIL